MSGFSSARAPQPGIAPVTLRSLIGTSRVRVDDRGLLERVRRGEAFIGAMWHEDIGFFGDFFRGTRFTVLASRSRDGEIAARIAHRLGLRTRAGIVVARRRGSAGAA